MRQLRTVLILLHVLAVTLAAVTGAAVTGAAVTGAARSDARLPRPLGTYLELTGSTQDWQLFDRLNHNAAWLVIEVQTDNQWRTVYRSRSPEHRWLGPIFDQQRVRSIVDHYTRLEHRDSYDALSVWLARRAAVDFPDSDHLRIHIQERPVLDAAVLRRDGWPTGTSHWQGRYSLDKYR